MSSPAPAALNWLHAGTDTRDERIDIALDAESRYERKVSWVIGVGDETYLFTHVAAPVMTRLRQPERQVLDTLVDAGVAGSRSEALVSARATHLRAHSGVARRTARRDVRGGGAAQARSLEVMFCWK